jgi:outer membrane protein W
MTKLDRIQAASIAHSALAALLLLGWTSDVDAQAGLPPPSLDQAGAAQAPQEGAAQDESAGILAAKLGGILPFNKLGPFVTGGIELGYVFGGTNRSIVALLDLTYSAPPASGTESDERVPEDEYEWELTHKQLVLQPTFLYRFTTADPGGVTPYVGIGPRLYLLENVMVGSAGSEQLGETTERSTKLGVGLPLGAEFALGQGGLFAELLLQWGPLDHGITGDTHLASASLLLGYRALL